jgi:hypothetical protein
LIYLGFSGDWLTFGAMGSRDARIGPEGSGAHIKNWALPYIDRRKSLALNLVNLPVSSAIGISLAQKRDTLNDTVNTLKGLGNSASAAGAIRIGEVSSQLAKHRIG